MKRTVLIILAVALMNQVFGQRDRRDAPVPAVIAPAEGIVYALPRTGVRLHVKVSKETFEPGPYARYAEQLLGITGVQTRASVNWNIEEVLIETFSEPDPNHVYKAVGNPAVLLSLTQTGVLAGINAAGAAQPHETPVATNNLIFKRANTGAFQFSSFNDTPMYAEGDSTNNFQPIRVSTEQKAAEAAARVLESRLARYEMVAGLFDEFHPDGDAYDESLKQLQKIEADYLSLFTGHTSFSREDFSFDCVPGVSAEKGEVVFRISDENGVVPPSDLSGEPVMLMIEPEKTLTAKYAGALNPENHSAGASGVYYRMPGTAVINIVYRLKTLATARTAIAQFGHVAPVPEELLMGGYQIEFHPETGAIKHLKAGN